MNLEKTHKDRFLAIDANAIVHRAFHAYPSTLETEDGVQVNAVYGFTVMLMSALKDFDPKYVLCAFDTHKPTFRHLEFPEYKATRKPTDQSLIDQFPLVENVLKAFNIPIIKKDGFEADDVLGTIASYVREGKWSNEDFELYILSGDKDLLQLVGDDVRVCLPAGSFKNLKVYDRDATYEYIGVYPNQVVDFKAIAGDSSDNIPGVKGVGEKTAKDLLARYGDLDEIYKNLQDVKTRYRNLLLEGVEQAELSKKLARIDSSVDINIPLESSVLEDFNRDEVLGIFKKFGFKSLISKLSEIDSIDLEERGDQLDIFSTASSQPVDWEGSEGLEEVFENSSEIVVVHVPREESSTGFPYLMVRTVDNSGTKKDFLTKEICSTSKPRRGTKVLTNHIQSFSNCDISDIEILDIKLFGHLISSERRGYTVRDIAFDYSKKVLPEKISPDLLTAVLDAVGEVRENQIKKANETELYSYTEKSLKNILKIREDFFLNVLKKIEIPISQILLKMQERGIKVDIEALKDLNDKLKKEISEIEEEIYEDIGHEFNINSPKQLSDILFNELGLPVKGKPSTKESVLVGLKGLHPVVEKVLRYREINKMYTTYTKPILDLARENSDNSIHTTFNQIGTTSGRFSSSNPNMQNIPIQGNWAEELRKTFVAREGFSLVGMDYSQMELRIMADISEDDLLIKDFRDGVDIHSSTAGRILGKEVEEVSKKERSLGKTVNFGILFGQTPYGLAKMLGVDSSVASEYIQNYFGHYRGVEDYIRVLEKEAYKKGYVQSMFGTTRYVRGIRSKNVRMLKAAQREAVNMPIQGSEADIMKLAMIRIDEMIDRSYVGKAFTILQVHDELIFEVEDSVVDSFVNEALDILEGVVSLEVPLVVHSSAGKNMSELK